MSGDAHHVIRFIGISRRRVPSRATRRRNQQDVGEGENMHEIIVFQTPTNKKDIRTITDEQGNPWWVAKDIAEALGYTVWNGTTSVAHVPQEWRGVLSVNTPSGVQNMITFSEQGLYFFLARSDKKAALPFQKWIAGEVLPSIRKTGGYSAAIPRTLPAALRAYAIEIEKSEALRKEIVVKNQKIEADAPKVNYFDLVALSPTCHKIGDWAKMIKFCLPDHVTPYGKPNQLIGPYIMFRILKGEKFLLHNRVPYQNHIDHFEVKQKGISMGEKRPCELVKVSIITVAGQLAVLKKLQDMGCYRQGQLKAKIPANFAPGQISLVVPRRANTAQPETAELPLLGEGESEPKLTGYGPI